MSLPNDIPRCRGVIHKSGMRMLKCATCLRYHTWRNDHEASLDLILVMEPPAKVSQCAEYVSPRDPRYA